MAAPFFVLTVWVGGRKTVGAVATLDAAKGLIFNASPRALLVRASVKHEGRIVYRLPASAEDRRREYLNYRYRERM